MLFCSVFRVSGAGGGADVLSEGLIQMISDSRGKQLLALLLVTFIFAGIITVALV